MIRVLIITALALASCATHKNKTQTSADKTQGISGMPPCLIAMIQNIKTNPKQKQTQSVTQYTYKAQTVFYVVSPCCDQMNAVYNTDCDYLGSPDGGITGKGDGKLPDFSKEASNAKLVWENK